MVEGENFIPKEAINQKTAEELALDANLKDQQEGTDFDKYKNPDGNPKKPEREREPLPEPPDGTKFAAEAIDLNGGRNQTYEVDSDQGR